MTHPARARAEKLFQRAAELPRDERGAFLNRKCGDDRALREEVESLLLQLDTPVTGFLQTWQPTPTPATPAPEPFAAGQVVAGKYKLLEILGEGGLGVVWIAEEAPPVRRRVALKVVKLGMDSKQVLARFEAERNALAIMNHPHIARVLDAGMTEAGQPFFAMELVPGLPITQFCDAERLTVAERLRVFINVCRAVQHAHQKGIIHRDLKPSNIIVMLREGKPVPKVIDFGIAKATAQALTERTIYTLQGQIIGTPEYMSPEQADMSEIGVDSTTDIYSLGVVLYELLTGVLPFDSKKLRSCGVAGISEMIRKVEPKKPSTRISTLGEDTSTISAAHRTDPRTLRSQLKGDLDWIVMKALAKQRTRRYPSASELAADVERHLRHEPVVAGPPRTWYKIRKFVRRNRTFVGGAVATLAMLVAGVVVSSWFAVRAAESARLATERGDLAMRRAYASALSTAELALRNHDVLTAQTKLESVLIDYRGWEWYHLWSRLDDSLADLEAPEGTSLHVYTIPGDSRFGVEALSASGRRAIASFDPWTGRRSTVPVAEGEKPASALSSPDGRYRIERDGPDGDPSWWLVEIGSNGDGRRTMLPACRVPRWLGRKLAVLAKDGGAYLMDPATDDRTDLDPSRRALRLFANRQHTRVVLVLDGGGMRLHAVPDGRLLASDRSHEKRVYQAVFLENGLLATISWDATVRLFDGETLEPMRVFHGHQNRLTDLRVAGDGSALASRGYGDMRRWKFWDTRRHDPRELRGHRFYVYAVGFHPEGRMLASGGWVWTGHGEVLAWDLRKRAQIGSAIETRTSVICSLAFSRDGRRLVTVDEEAHARVYDVKQGGFELLVEHEGYPGNPYGPLTFHPDSVRLLWPGSGTFRVWDTNSDAVVAATPEFLRELDTGHAAPDGSVIATHDGREIRCYDPSAKRECARVAIDGRYRRFAYLQHPKHGLLLLVPRKGAPRVTPWGRSIGRFADVPMATALVDPRTGREVATLEGHSGEVMSIAVSPDGQRIATCGRDGIIRIWDADTFDELVALAGHTEYVFGLAWSPDGSQLASGSGDTTVRIWETTRLRKTLLDAK